MHDWTASSPHLASNLSAFLHTVLEFQWVTARCTQELLFLQYSSPGVGSSRLLWTTLPKVFKIPGCWIGIRASQLWRCCLVKITNFSSESCLCTESGCSTSPTKQWLLPSCTYRWYSRTVATQKWTHGETFISPNTFWLTYNSKTADIYKKKTGLKGQTPSFYLVFWIISQLQFQSQHSAVTAELRTLKDVLQ